MWLEVFVLARIFVQTAYMMRMIMYVTKRLGWFMVVLAIIVAAFANSFLILSKVQDCMIIRDNDPFYAIEYVYQMCLAEFETEDFPTGNYNYIASLVFLLGTFMLLIVMLNLIIGLINSIFSEINEDVLCHAYKELVATMKDNMMVVNTEKLFRHMKYMVVINNEDTDKQLDLPTTSIKVLIDEIEQNNKREDKEYELCNRNMRR